MMNRLISASGLKKYYLYYQLLNITSIWMIKNLPISNIMQIVFNIISQKRYMRFSNSAPLVYMTYSILQRIEIDNLKHIVEGIRYNQPVSKLKIH